MHHYVEQFHAINGLVSGRIDVTECQAPMRKSITNRIKTESLPDYKIRLVKGVEAKRCFPPILKQSSGTTTNRIPSARHATNPG
jgi:hypothetical protein